MKYRPLIVFQVESSDGSASAAVKRLAAKVYLDAFVVVCLYSVSTTAKAGSALQCCPTEI